MFADVDDAGAVWVTHRQNGTVSRFMPNTGEQSIPITIEGGPFAVKVAFGKVWVTDRSNGKLYRIEAQRDESSSQQGEPAGSVP
jgi:streptogramin lyase